MLANELGLKVAVLQVFLEARIKELDRIMQLNLVE